MFLSGLTALPQPAHRGDACILPLLVSLPKHEGMVEALAPAAELNETTVVD